VPEWTIILDRPRADVFAAARRTLVLELALLGGVALLDLALLVWILMRARADARIERERAQQRRERYEREHQVATTLQRSLLAEVPQIDAIDSAARYQAGSTGLEVGGDWFDVLRRPDGIVHATVGDVAGHGVAAAALMGQLRNAFRAYAYEHTSPAAIMSRLLRHVAKDEMATAICITIDPYARELAYASAGHPPPLLRDDASGVVTPLEGAQSPLLAPVSRTIALEAHLALPPRATLVAYTDGMVEQRDRIIDDGIERLAAELRSAKPDATADALADTLIHDVAEVIAADDDIALLVMRFGGVPASVDIELPPRESALDETRRRLRLWMLARGAAGSQADAALLVVGEAVRAVMEPVGGEPLGVRLQIVHEAGAFDVTANPS
jgi:serine phosphatase RsbU (regulator of sigma subunit)